MTGRKRKVTKEANMLVRLSHDLHEKIHKLAEKEEVSVSELVRRTMRREVSKMSKYSFNNVIEFLTPCDGEWINTLDPKEYLSDSLEVFDFRQLLVDLCLNLGEKELASIVEKAKQSEIDEYKNYLESCLE